MAKEDLAQDEAALVRQIEEMRRLLRLMSDASTAVTRENSEAPLPGARALARGTTGSGRRL